jgi:hypothetical protein
MAVSVPLVITVLLIAGVIAIGAGALVLLIKLVLATSAQPRS